MGKEEDVFPKNLEKEDSCDIPFEHEDKETYQLRCLYQSVVKEIRPEVEEETQVLLAMLVVKKARYGVVYEDDVEKIIDTFNQEIRDYYG